MNSLIYNETEVRKFYNKVILNQPRTDFDVDFFCIAARKKYMSQEERDLTRLGDTCIMEKTVLKELNEDIFIHKLQKVDYCLDHLYSLNGTNIPRSCMVFYMNINHTNSVSVLKTLKTDITTVESELYDVLLKNGLKENIGKKLKRLDTLVLKAYQNPANVSKRTWIDIDMDVSTELISYEEIETALDCMLLDKVCGKLYEIIQTRGGYHILVNTIDISAHNTRVAQLLEDFKSSIISIKDFTNTLENLVSDKGIEAKEIKINPNGMVPIPGTLQGGFKVKMV